MSGLPLKRSLAERLGKKIEVDKAPRRGKRASGFAAQILFARLLRSSSLGVKVIFPALF